MTTEYESGDEGQEESEPQSDKDRNFAALRAKLEAVESENAELRPLRTEKVIREAGFDPASDQGKAIKYGLQVNKVEETADKVQEFALTEFGWKPKAQLTTEEATRQVTTDRMDSLQAQSEPETPPDTGDDIAAAEAEGDFAKSGMLKLSSYIEQQNIAQ